MRPNAIMLALTEGPSAALGNIWKITAKKTDFYLNPLGNAGVIHLSVHGPNQTHRSHRFHLRLDRRAAMAAVAGGQFLAHSIMRRGNAFNGRQVGDDAYLVARLRWTWDLQRQRYRAAAATEPAPGADDPSVSYLRMRDRLKPNSAWDVDLHVAYGRPYWPDAQRSDRDNSRLGPLRNEAGMWLTGTSYHRSQSLTPAPGGLQPPLPRAGEAAIRILGAALGEEPDDFYWFLETLTSRSVIEATQASQAATGS